MKSQVYYSYPVEGDSQSQKQGHLTRSQHALHQNVMWISNESGSCVVESTLWCCVQKKNESAKRYIGSSLPAVLGGKGRYHQLWCWPVRTRRRLLLPLCFPFHLFSPSVSLMLMACFHVYNRYRWSVIQGNYPHESIIISCRLFMTFSSFILSFCESCFVVR